MSISALLSPLACCRMKNQALSFDGKNILNTNDLYKIKQSYAVGENRAG